MFFHRSPQISPEAKNKTASVPSASVLADIDFDDETFDQHQTGGSSRSDKENMEIDDIKRTIPTPSGPSRDGSLVEAGAADTPDMQSRSVRLSQIGECFLTLYPSMKGNELSPQVVECCKSRIASDRQTRVDGFALISQYATLAP